MKASDTDILKDNLELKKMPFSVPEGYFDAFKEAMCRPQAKIVSLWSRLTPYAAVAAVFIFLVSAGTFILEHTTPQQEMTQEDYILFSDSHMNIIEDDFEAEPQLADADIIDYLIFCGITPEEIEEEIELSK